MKGFVRIPRDVAYAMNLDNQRNVKNLQYRFRNDAVIYGIRCQIDNMIYIGETTNPRLRFHKHLITGEKSNENLQAAIAKYGLGKFTVHIFMIVPLPSDSSFQEKKRLLRT
jgi:GIY-YIG catalytic domain